MEIPKNAERVFYCIILPHEDLLRYPCTCVYPMNAYNFKEARQISLEYYITTFKDCADKCIENIKFTTNNNSAPNEWLLRTFRWNSLKLKFLI
jgi:hypothetical protein